MSLESHYHPNMQLYAVLLLDSTRAALYDSQFRIITIHPLLRYGPASEIIGRLK